MRFNTDVAAGSHHRMVQADGRSVAGLKHSRSHARGPAAGLALRCARRPIALPVAADRWMHPLRQPVTGDYCPWLPASPLGGSVAAGLLGVSVVPGLPDVSSGSTLLGVSAGSGLTAGSDDDADAVASDAAGSALFVSGLPALAAGGGLTIRLLMVMCGARSLVRPLSGVLIVTLAAFCGLANTTV